MRLLVLPLVVLLLWAPRAGAGERQEAAPRPAAPTRGAPVRDLAYAHAVVTNARGQVLDGLAREMFTLLEHGAAKSMPRSNSTPRPASCLPSTSRAR